MTSFASAFPSTAYLLPAQKRLRWRDMAGAPDIMAATTAAQILPTAKGLSQGEKERLGRVLLRVAKAAVAFGDAGATSMLEERFGFPVFIEVPIGGVRRGVGVDGPWERQMEGCGYGFLPDTVARDSDELDVILGPALEATDVYVITQLDENGAIDEYKLAIGFASADEAEATYLRNWPAERFGGIASMPIEVLAGLLGFEIEEPGIVMKAAEAVSASDALILKAPSGVLVAKIAGVSKAVWSAAYVNTLPDSAFLYIAPGGEKDDEGKTVPRSLRYFPVKDRDGQVDLPHLRNALARIPQAKIPQSAKDDARRKAEQMLEDIKQSDVEKSAASLPIVLGDGLELERGLVLTKSGAGSVWEAVEMACARREKVRKAVASALAFTGNAIPIAERSDLAAHPALTAPLSWRYTYPEQVGGWLGAIEAIDGSWIAFVAIDGKTLLWTEREADGGVVGEPVEFRREDLAASMSAATKAVPTRYEDIDFSPPAGVREAARRGLALHAEGKTGDGLEPATVAWAQRIADGDEISPDKARQGARWMARNRRFKDEPKDSAAWASYMLWFGDAGDAWFAKLVEQMDARDRDAGIAKKADRIAVRMNPIAKGMSAETPKGRRIVIGVVLEPEPFGGAGDAHDETYDAETIEQAAHHYLASFGMLDDMHGRFFRSDEVAIVESYIAPCDFELGGACIKKGSWVIAAKILSDDLWARVLRGELNAWSIEGFSERYCTGCDAPMKSVVDAQQRKQWVCQRCDLGGARFSA